LITLLTGETHADAGNHEAAVACYLAYMARNGREESILRALGNTYQTMGESEKARNIYAELLDACKTCHRPADTDLKKRYADTSFATGQHTIPVLEIYLELAEKDPRQRGDHYQKVSAIYKALGNEGEARRFAEFSKKAR
jgi:tetratricopeptide (TPR) repeat protein